ncbi:MAG: arylsulfatase, partial [Ferruginibacter sp.]|nr:arylsulfatase [Ferruginibacter sp.]
GWDVYREKVIAKQKKLGLIPANAQLPDRNSIIKAWNSLSADQKKLYARFMEVYAGYLEYTDYEIGRIVNHLKSINQLENTAFFIILGDNGASKEGDINGTINVSLGERFFKKSDDSSELKNNLANINLIGKPQGIESNYPLGWAQATNTPFKSWKQDANSEGGTRNPLIVFYPKGVTDKGGIRNQYGYVSDILPTTLDLIGVKAPSVIKGIQQDPITGSTLVKSFNDKNIPSKHTKQYYYIFGARAIYKDGWKAAAAHYPDFVDLVSTYSPKNTSRVRDYDKDKWELYDLTNDFNERVDLSKKYPEKLAELKALFEEEAKTNNIYPFIDWEDVLRQRIHKTGK